MSTAPLQPPAETDYSPFEAPPSSKRRLRKSNPNVNQNNRASAYNMYATSRDDASRQPGFAASGFNVTNGDLENRQQQKHAALLAAAAPQPPAAIPLAAPRPGYPAPVAALNVASPPPSAPPEMKQVPQSLRITRPQADLGSPRMPPPIYQTGSPRPSVPSAPHPLQPPMTPITPVFARPVGSPSPANDVKFPSDAIMRGGSEDNLLPKRGERGDDFWRRFSIVAREEKKTSVWLSNAQSSMNRLSRWVWFVGVILFICIAIACGVGWYISHNSPSHQPPTAVGGSAGETIGASSVAGSTSSPHVSPTNTVARRAAMSDPVPTAINSMHGHSYIDEDIKPNTLRHGKKHRLRRFER
ncbi:hypothetical protein F5I97DRAFT_1830425 [Phlebopus sp. FC_14]|nr:hypothetical protein F5I97DRAFT_1830425 [Phlebopus sp. FC_14]